MTSHERSILSLVCEQLEDYFDRYGEHGENIIPKLLDQAQAILDDKRSQHGQLAYEAYCAQVGWKSIKGDPLPPFRDLPPHIETAWEAAATAVASKFWLEKEKC